MSGEVIDLKGSDARLPTYGLLIGSKLIVDITQPRAEEMDLPAIDARLDRIHRFSNDPRALTVRQHQEVVGSLAQLAGESYGVIGWAKRHDRHEGIIGDIPGPLSGVIRLYTGILDVVKTRLDLALCAAEGITYPDVETRRLVHHYDKVAETLEWHIVLGQPIQPWCCPVSLTMLEAGAKIIDYWQGHPAKTD